jgi:hypothetical protein
MNYIPSGVRHDVRSAAAKLNKSIYTLNNWRAKKRGGPAWFTDGRDVFYLDEDLEAFAASRIRRHEPRRAKPLTTTPNP